MVLECEPDHGSQWAAILSTVQKIGRTPETLQPWVRRVEVGHRATRRRDE